jgi:hypothetical protein
VVKTEKQKINSSIRKFDNRQMKKITSILPVSVIFLGIFTMVVLNACKKKDPCEEKTCSNPFHVCENGSCGCSAGYEGDSCNVYSAVKFLGNYQVNENCPNLSNQNYTSFISTSSRYYQVLISNIANIGTGYQVYASVTGNYISIPEQTLGSSRIVGEGTYQPLSRTIQMQYEYNVNGVSRSCTATFQKF